VTLIASSADQYTEQTLRIRIRKNGQRVVESRELTIQYIYNVYYWYEELIVSKTMTPLLTVMARHSRMVNVGSLGSIATTLMEKYIGFWSAYLLDLCAVVLAMVIVLLARPNFGMRHLSYVSYY
jgi:POT family proton-dependent oligopeptide transporter